MGWEYAPALRGSFVYEDDRLSTACEDPLPTDPNAPRHWPTLSSIFGGRRIIATSWCWEVAQQHTPLTFHLVNLALHALVTGLVALLVWRVTANGYATAAAAAFFCLNAIAVEAVAYLSGRSELLAAAGVLGACLAGLARRWWLAVVCLGIGLGGKESALVAFALLPLLLWYRHALSARLTFAGLGVVTAASLWFSRAWWAGAPSREAWALLQTRALARLVTLSVFPFGQTVDYDYAHVSVLMQWLAACALLAAIGWAWRHRHRARLAWCGVCWVLCAALPRLLVPTPRSVFTEHQFYVPLVGMSLVLASVFHEARP